MAINKKTLLGYGPSRVRIINTGNVNIVYKSFPMNEFDRFIKEVEKMKYLTLLGEITGKFKVPKIFDISIENAYYTTEYISNSEISFQENPAIISSKIVDIINTIAQSKHGNNTVLDLWNLMILKFKSAKTNDKEYFDLVDSLLEPKFLILGYSHGDLTFDNILYHKNDWYLIDPSWSAVESPIWDVGKILQSTAANWNGIKCNGIVGEKPQWLIELNEKVIDEMLKVFSAEEMLLGLACQLARVSRWCFSDELIRIIKNLLRKYIDGYNCINILKEIK